MEGRTPSGLRPHQASQRSHTAGGTGRVLYPASCKASTDLQDSLAASGFRVSRLNTYDTVGGQVLCCRFSVFPVVPRP